MPGLPHSGERPVTGEAEVLKRAFQAGRLAAGQIRFVERYVHDSARWDGGDAAATIGKFHVRQHIEDGDRVQEWRVELRVNFQVISKIKWWITR